MTMILPRQALVFLLVITSPCLIMMVCGEDSTSSAVNTTLSPPLSVTNSSIAGDANSTANASSSTATPAASSAVSNSTSSASTTTTTTTATTTSTAETTTTPTTTTTSTAATTTTTTAATTTTSTAATTTTSTVFTTTSAVTSTNSTTNPTTANASATANVTKAANLTSENTTAPVTTSTTPLPVNTTTAVVVDHCLNKPCHNNGNCTSNTTNYTCKCAPGWSGINCDEATTCSLSPCINGVCSASSTNYTCICGSGYTGRNCDKDINECDENPCNHLVDRYCINKPGSYDCVCKPGLEEIDGHCQKITLWSTDNTGLSVTTKGANLGRFLPIGFPFYGRRFRYIMGYTNGYVSLGEGVSMDTPPVYSSWPYSPVYLGVYWAATNGANISFTEDSTKLDNISADSSLLHFVKNVSNFDALYVLAFTWNSVEPKNVPDSNKSLTQKATFQVILATDGIQSLAIKNYRTVWSSVNEVNKPLLLPTYTWINETLTKDKVPTSASQEVIKFFNQINPDTSTQLQTCLRNVQTAFQDIGNRTSLLPPCPCNSKQASLDFQFVLNSQTNCYNSRFKFKISNQSFQQTCCYDSLGLLLKNNENARIPIYEGSEKLNTAYQTCCKINNDFCQWFYGKFPSSDCSSYRAATLAAGFGDPHILTFDGNKYSFQNVGDFVVFKTGSIEFQGRTKTSTKSNTTFFTEYALNMKEFNNTVIFKAALPDFKNLSAQWKENSIPMPDQCSCSITSIDQYTVAFITTSFSVEVHKKDEILSHRVLVNTENFTTEGLMGTRDLNQTNDFKFQNGAVLVGTVDNLNGSVINQFVESWKLNASTSLFGDSGITTFVPPVIETTIAKIKLQMNSSEDEAKAKELCGEELFCWQDYYLTKDNNSAADTLKQALDLENSITELSLTPPSFKNIEPFKVNVSVPYSLKLEVTGNKTVNFDIQDANSWPGARLENSSFIWNLSVNLEALRQKVYPSLLKFIAKDSHNLTSDYKPSIYLCLCADVKQCAFDLSPVNDTTGDPEGNVKNVPCKCDGRKSGRYCQQDVNVCLDCFNQTGCNQTLDKYCPACPSGYDGDGFSCADKDECAIDNGGCEQKCTNIKGSFECSCLPGYTQNGTACIDINECEYENETMCSNIFQFCTNSKGSYKCECYPGRIGDKCIKAQYTYKGDIVIGTTEGWSLNLLNTASTQFQDLAENVSYIITKAITETLGLANDTFIVEVLSFEIYEKPNSTSNNLSRKKRELPVTPILATYVIYLPQNFNASELNQKLQEAFKSQRAGCLTNCLLYGTRLLTSGDPSLNVTADLCDVRQINPCDPQSTVCYSKDNKVGCNCKSGFTKSIYDPNSCIDINECLLNKCNASQFCTNLFGTYMCSCEPGYDWDLTRHTCKNDNCHPNPCKNDGSCSTTDTDPGFLCSCSYEWTGKTCEDYDSEARRMKIAVICISVILGFFCLCLLIILLVVCCKHRKTLESDSYTNSRFKDFDGVPRPKIKYAAGRPDMAENGRGNTYDSLYTNDNDNHSSAGNHTHRNGDKEGGKYYMNKAFDNSEVVQERL